MGTHPAAVVTDDERRVLDRIGESELVEVAQRLVRAPGQNPPGGDESRHGTA